MADVMNCETVRETLLDVLPDAASRGDLASALSHLGHCVQCQAAIGQFDQITAQLRSVEADEPSGGWDQFQLRLTAAIEERPMRMRPASYWRSLLGVAASIVLAIGAYWLGQNSSQRDFVSTSPQRTAGTEPSVIAGIEPSQAMHDATAFAEMSEVFENRAKWMLVSDSSGSGNSSDLGLSTHAIGADESVIVLRLMMLRHSLVVSTVDLVIVPGQSADLTVFLAPGQSVHYHADTSTANDTALSLSAEIRTPQGDRPLAALSTTLPMKTDGQISAGELETSAGRYELKTAFTRITTDHKDLNR